MLPSAGTDGSDKHVVGVGSLRVLLYPEDGGWCAQGIEIDYTSCGDTVEEAKRRFVNGLADTIRFNLELHGNVDNILRYAPQDARERAEAESCHLLDLEVFHEDSFPFHGLAYLKEGSLEVAA